MFEKIRYLLLQVRNTDDPMAGHEVGCFARSLNCSLDQIRVFDLLQECPSLSELAMVDIVLLGGSGDYSVVEGGPWMEPALEAMRELDEVSKPTFASCWGFQAMARALGGTVVTDRSRAEVGTHQVHLTPAGKADPIFGILGDDFAGQMGHQDIVETLPEHAVLLASTGTVRNQAFRLQGKPIYCTQFHPELTNFTLLDRLRTYPHYVEEALGIPYEEFERNCVRESPKTDRLLAQFVRVVMG